jgi:hypothetical protein
MGGTWAVGCFRHVLRGLIFLRLKQKWQENCFTEKKVIGLSLATTFKSDRIMVFWDPMSKNKKQNSTRR